MSTIERSITFFAIQNFEKGTKSLEKGLFRQKRDHFSEFSDQKSLKGTKCHLRDRLVTTVCQFQALIVPQLHAKKLRNP